MLAPPFLSPTEMLINNISRSLFATANDELRPVMNGIYFDLTADALAIVASAWSQTGSSKNFTIKSESLLQHSTCLRSQLLC